MKTRLRELQRLTHSRIEGGTERWDAKVECAELLLSKYALKLEEEDNYFPLPLPEYLTNKELDEVLNLFYL